MPTRKSTIRWLQILALIGMLNSVAASAIAGDRVALLIGVNQAGSQSDLSPLKWAAKDVADMRDTLLTLGYDANDIVVLNSTSASTAPTAANIRDQLAQLEQVPGHIQSVMIVFAGHGFNDNQESYLCPADYDRNRPLASAVAVREIQQLLEELNTPGRFLIIDACRNEFLSRGATDFNLNSSLSRLHVDATAKSQGVVVLSSCMPGQQSWEMESPNAAARSLAAIQLPQPNRNGVFMHYIMQGLKGAADSLDQQSGFDGRITASELCEFAARETYACVRREFDTEQTPWADLHATADLAIVALTPEQQKQRPEVKVRSRQNALNAQIAEHKTGDGVMLLVGGEPELRQFAIDKFTEAITLSPDLYMPRRLRALLRVLDGNNSLPDAPRFYQQALEDMQAVGSPLRLAIPLNYPELRLAMTTDSRNAASSAGFSPAASVRGGDVIEVDGIETHQGKSWLRVTRVNRWAEQTTDTPREDINALIALDDVARPDANRAQIQDVNRLRKPTSDQLRTIRQARLENANNQLDEFQKGIRDIDNFISPIPGSDRVTQPLRRIDSNINRIRDFGRNFRR